MKKIVAVSHGKFSVKKAPKLSAKCLEDKICKIKQIKIIPLTLKKGLGAKEKIKLPFLWSLLK